MSLLRVRFHADHDDPRPLNFPVEHPYWITGQGDDYSVVVSYADNLEYIKENWPEANNIEAQQVDGYVFTDRFSKPQWWEVIQLRADVARLTAELAAANEDAALPDYNPNGTANPKGDAAYWRTRAESAETKVSEYAKALLLVEMRIISEEAYCAGWMLGLEWACMDIVAGRISNYGLLADFDLHKRTLEELHKFAGGWWMWRDGDQEEIFVLDANIVNYKVEGGEE